MATRVETTYIDDLDGTSPADGTVRFGLDGTEYEIDLTTAHTDAFRTALAPYIEVARKATVTRTPTAARSGRRSAASRNGDIRDINHARRAWLRSQGHTVSERGRIAPALLALVPENVMEIMTGEPAYAAPPADGAQTDGLFTVTRTSGPDDGDTTGTVSVNGSAPEPAEPAAEIITTPEQTAAVLDGATADPATATTGGADGETGTTKTTAKTRAPRSATAAKTTGRKTTKTTKTTAEAPTA